MYTLINDVMSLGSHEANATFYSMTKDCWNSLSPKSQKAWDLLLKQEKMRILNDAMTRSTKPANDPRQQSANSHERHVTNPAIWVTSPGIGDTSTSTEMQSPGFFASGAIACFDLVCLGCL
jgi:hypothetical protein